MQAGGRRFDPVILHQQTGGALQQEPIYKREAYILAFADNETKLIFKNLEEVKKVIHAEAGMGNYLCGSMKNMGFDCINRIHSSRMNVAQTRDDTLVTKTLQEGLTL